MTKIQVLSERRLPKPSVALSRKRQNAIQKKAAISKQLRNVGEYEYSDDNYCYLSGDGVSFLFDGVAFDLYLETYTIPDYHENINYTYATLKVDGKLKHEYYGEVYLYDIRDFPVEMDKLCKSVSAFIKQNIKRSTNPHGLDARQALRLANYIVDNQEMYEDDNTPIWDAVDQFEKDADEEDEEYRDMMHDYYTSIGYKGY